MLSIQYIYEKARRIDIYLAYQKIADGRIQIRRYSPNAHNKEIRLFEPVSDRAIKWLEDNGCPDFDKIDQFNPSGSAPYDVFYIGDRSCNRV